MRSILCMAGVGLAVAAAWAFPVSALDVTVRQPAQQAASSPDGVLVAIEADKPAYRIGEDIVLTATTRQACFLTIIDVDHAGVATVLFPNKFRPNNFVAAGSTIKVPSSEDQFTLALSEDTVSHDTVTAVCDADQREIDGIVNDFASTPLTTIKINPTLGITIRPKVPKATIEIRVTP